MTTDRAMLGVSGDQAAAAVKAASPATPVIMLRGFGGLTLAAGGRPEGADVVVGTPLTRRAARDALAAVRGRGESASSSGRAGGAPDGGVGLGRPGGGTGDVWAGGLLPAHEKVGAHRPLALDLDHAALLELW
ncbi:MAG TPA: hypothetical protein VFX49_18500 [Chloroflexota bacterium]|nr:hypothetical protein [Chloroflexota bacterium]